MGGVVGKKILLVLIVKIGIQNTEERLLVMSVKTQGCQVKKHVQAMAPTAADSMVFRAVTATATKVHSTTLETTVTGGVLRRGEVLTLPITATWITTMEMSP